MHSTRPIAVLAAALALLAGCSTSTSSTDKTSGTTSVTTSAAVPASTTLPADTTENPPVTETSQSRALAAKLIAAVPGYVVQPNSLGDTGPSDLDKAVRDDGRPNAREELTSDHFVVGYQRLFTPPDKGRFVILFLYQFADPAGASKYLQSTAKAALAPLDGATVTPFAVPGIAGATGVQGKSGGTTFHDVEFVKGNYLVMVETNDEHGDAAKPSAVDLAAQQYARL